MPAKIEQVYFRFNKPRKQQKRLMQDIAQTINNESNLVVHAAVGLGKTDAALSPAISYALKNNKKVFFLTPKISQHEIALEVCRDLALKFDLDFKAIDLVGRKYMCLHPFISTADQGFYELCKKVREDEQCELFGNAVGYTKKEIAKAKYHVEAVKKRTSSAVSHLAIKEQSKTFSTPQGEKPLCPYEVSLQIAKDCQVLIADYYHVFNPEVRRMLFSKLDIDLKDCIFIVDEAHNLPDRIRNLLSQSLSSYLLDRALIELEKLNKPEQLRDLKLLLTHIHQLAKENLSVNQKEALIEASALADLPNQELDFKQLSEELRTSALDYMEKTTQGRSALLSVANFLGKWFTDETSVVRILKQQSNGIFLQLRSLDASSIASTIFSQTHSNVLMSGTLLPTKMYADVLGLPSENTLLREYYSDFPNENSLNLIVPNFSSKYSKRNFEEYGLIAKKIASITSLIPGNTAVFFPSFNFLHSVKAQFPSEFEKTILSQKENMNSYDKFQLLNAFRQASQNKGALLFACANGSLSEGINLPGNELLGAIIVGIPLQELSLEVKCLIDYCQDKFGAGWKYAYLYPAVVRALQAAGRVIRSEDDKGVIVFLDERYTWKNYKTCLPKNMEFLQTTEPEKYIEQFKFN